ncbi:protein of unknown function [Magnetospirillum gryphiswaldense MSR-1 v2]|uniref:Uncharacterized protein n=1 Tax=Magnetospirillum gryphiswaldense (strain DSM 6361 / JCM 21280 / NBRC 15271 / MSR-1) TaxID=431944 RepID=V6F3Y3_MAGGM|nr:protein of unknown function [Magnetospirillum gryphiswaldense MSR-1 v2]
MLPFEQHIARVSLGVLIDLRMTCRAQKDQVVERICVEIARRSVFMARPSIAMGDDMRHFRNVLVAAHFDWE